MSSTHVNVVRAISWEPGRDWLRRNRTALRQRYTCMCLLTPLIVPIFTSEPDHAAVPRSTPLFPQTQECTCQRGKDAGLAKLALGHRIIKVEQTFLQHISWNWVVDYSLALGSFLNTNVKEKKI